MEWMFKEDHLLEHRCMESVKIPAKYPNWVPVIVEKVLGSQIIDTDKWKYLVPSDNPVVQFTWIIRERIQLSSEKAIFLFSLHEGEGKDENRFLYVAYNGDNTFGF
ncbi:unnamed protein product [Nyctereutes procyonoides]|uniref:(raccoon dog) hypothetical protein n=1 Tax=Nyctereutes procyonoides TaxID=34880 RepID=A0A812A103_NYCPR|nr:unnamed protein product [Nyctereutes procyonoides]